MHKLIFGVFLLIINTSFSLPISDKIAAAFKSGNTELIAKHFGNSIELSVPSNEGVFSKTQAKLILKTFFTNHQPTNFKVVHNGDSKNNSHYSIGTLTTKKGAYRTYVLYQIINNKITILELRIESDE